MTDAGWAEKKVYRLWGKQSLCWSLVAKLLKAEHARSVRIVNKVAAKFLLLKGQKGEAYTQYNMGYNDALNDVLTTLQRGRGGKG